MTNLCIDACIVCLGRGEFGKEIKDKDYLCPYSKMKCRYLDMNPREVSERINAYDDMPEGMSDILWDKMMDNDFEVIEDQNL